MGAAAPQRPRSRRRPLSRDQQVSEMPRAEMPRAELLAMPRALLDHVAKGTRVPVMCNILVKSYNRQASVTFERLMGYQQNLRQSIGGQAPVPNPMSSQVSHL